ncbi:glycosyltransferase [Vibrio mediterranei]|uniref:glycosyltransferase n=1 Tax=Vibrio mediterranei TaxID=689 RepID=UPI0038CE68B1
MRKTVLISAYDVSPFKGSESATGWNIPYEMAKYSRNDKFLVVTRENNAHDINQFCEQQSEGVPENIKFIYFDLPSWARFWKRGARGAFLYYYLWQFSVAFYILRNNIKCDVYHSLNFHCNWCPSFLWVPSRFYRAKFYWGPINHNELVPRQVIFQYGFKPFIKDRVTWLIKLVFWYCDPFIYLCKWNADLIFVGNALVSKRLRLQSEKVIELDQVASSARYIEKENAGKSTFKFLIIARALPIKNILLTLDAFVEFYKTNRTAQLTLVGLSQSNTRDIVHHKFKDYLEQGAIVDFGWVDFRKMDSVYHDHDCVVFCSFEGAGLTIAESLLYGCSLICLSNYGPGRYLNHAGIKKIIYKSNDVFVQDLSSAMQSICESTSSESKTIHPSEIARYGNEKFTWRSKAISILENYF